MRMVGVCRNVGSILICLVCMALSPLMSTAQPSESNWVRSMAWHPAEDWIAYSTEFGEIRVVEASSGIVVHDLNPSMGQATYVIAWSPDASKLAAGGSGNVIDIWTMPDGQLVHTLLHSGEIRSLSWSPSGAELAVAGQNGFPENVRVWDLNDQQIVFSPVVGEVLSVAFSPDGKRLALAKFGGIQFWDPLEQELTGVIGTPEYSLSLAWNPDGTRIASADTYVAQQSTIRIWDAESGALFTTLHGHENTIPYVAWYDDSTKVVSASLDETIRVWDADTGASLVTFRTNTRAYAAALSPFGGRLAYAEGVAANARPTLRIVVPDPSLDRLNGIAAACVPETAARDPLVANSLAEVGAFVERLDALPDDTIPPACRADLLAVAEALLAQSPNSDPLVYIRNRSDKEFELVGLSEAGRTVFELTSDDCFSISPRNTYLALSSPQSKTIGVFLLTTSERILEIPADSLLPCTFDWRTDTRLVLTAREDHTPQYSQAVDISSGEVRQIEPGERSVAVISRDQIPHLLPDDFWLVSPDQSLVTYNKCVGAVLTTVYGIQTCGAAGQIVVYDISSEQEIALLADTYQELFSTQGGDPFTDNLAGFEWSPDSRLLVYRTINDRVVTGLRIFDTVTRTFTDVDRPPGTDLVRIRGFAWSPDGERVAFWLHDYAAKGMRLGVFDISSTELGTSTQLFDVAPSSWVWRSDNRSIIFVDAGFNLIQYDVELETTSILDTNVWDILTSR
ncbi:MAG: hypothetical protein IPM16_16375 [Chloroflexi bacterium]|nr:hypothetical protein [Chloroflexota bacterium]